MDDRIETPTEKDLRIANEALRELKRVLLEEFVRTLHLDSVLDAIARMTGKRGGEVRDQNDPMTTWREELERVFRQTGDSFDTLVAITLTDEELDEEFDSGFGMPEGKAFTAWSTNWVYFPIEYDGAESADFVARHPGGPTKSHRWGEQ